jgi:hypothetical protein
MSGFWMSEEFKHRRREEAHEVSFWKDNVASTIDEGNRAVVEVRCGIYSSRLDFEWPTDKAKVDTLESMLRSMFEFGQRDAKREIRKVLGVTG